jgi:hypothetical protein
MKVILYKVKMRRFVTVNPFMYDLADINSIYKKWFFGHISDMNSLYQTILSDNYDNFFFIVAI